MTPVKLSIALSRRYIGVIGNCNKVHTNTRLYKKEREFSDEHFKGSGSLWFTALPRKSLTNLIRAGKRKPPKNSKRLFMPPGPLLISCKNEKLNHYRGTFYPKLETVPLASKGWHSRKANGDYFSIMPMRKNPAFLLPQNFPAECFYEGNNLDSDEFKALGVNEELINKLRNIGIHYPTGIQIAAIPKILAGKNVVMTAETGCGKTLAYGIPILQHIMSWKPMMKSKHNSPLALIVVPTRELALQVGNVFSDLVEGTDINYKVILANRTKKFLMNFDESDLENVDVLVGTLGVLCKLTYHQVYSMKRCLHVVFDEADTLLDDSFSEKLMKLLGRCKFRLSEIENDEIPNGAQLSFVSATIPKNIEETVKSIIPPHILHKISTKYLHKIPPHVKQNFVRCKKSAKPENVLDLVKKELKRKRPVIIFSNKTETCNWLAHFLRENGIECSRFNSQMSIEERIVELDKFREGRVNVITCTDLASRGQDITRVTHVVNYEFPRYMADYVHRCGRTGRIGNEEECEVTSYISSLSEVPLLKQIELSVRRDAKLANVNNNIKRILGNKYKLP